MFRSRAWPERVRHLRRVFIPPSREQNGSYGPSKSVRAAAYSPTGWRSWIWRRASRGSRRFDSSAGHTEHGQLENAWS